MAVIAGIDEAGYGPILGPLVVSGVAFRVPDEQIDACLWDTLKESCARSARRGERRLAIADSKKLYSPRNGIAPLERAALVMLAVAGHRPKTWLGLLDAISPGAARYLDEYPWYQGADPSLPLSESVGDVYTRANAVRVDCAGRNVELIDVFSEPVPEGHFNRLIEKTRNKAVVLLGVALRCVDRIMSLAPGEPVRICVDRLGGRRHYRESLSLAFPGTELRILEESDRRSGYRFTYGARVCTIEFVTGGESHHMPVALASIYSKYLRELHMHIFNRYWERRQDGLKPTAGYYTDARRWLKDAARTLDKLSVDRAMLERRR